MGLLSLIFTITLHVVVEEQAVVRGEEAEVGVVALVRKVSRGQAGVARRSERTADTLGSLEILNVPRQIHTFTLKTEHREISTGLHDFEYKRIGIFD